jgi:dTDP-4-amino-4,6-dideoxygalactose transaminase/transketolase C-terminal domain/subunit
MNPESTPKTMRDVLIEAIYKKMADNPRIFFLSADFGAPALDKLRKDFPDRFINVGIAEQNLINIATGLALEGNIVFAYAIAPFLTMRAYEQIRLNLSISNQIKPVNVNLIGVGGGMGYDVAGPTHHCLEDLSLMRMLPGMTVFSPSDWKLVENFVDYSINKETPVYFRLDGKPVLPIYDQIKDLNIEKGFYELKKGKGVCLISTGYLTQKALKAAQEIPEVGLIDVFLLKPLDEKRLFEVIKNYNYVITLEEGFINSGGLDSLISKIILENKADIELKRMGLDDKYAFELGERSYLHELNNLSEESIIKTVQQFRHQQIQPMEIKYHLAEDTIDKEDINQLIGWLKTNPRLTKGKLTLDFEKKWSDWVGKKYSVFCNSGSSANLLMFNALLLSGVLKNKKVIVPSVGWVTTIAPAIQLGFEPIMCEADPDTFGLDLNHLEELLKKHNPSAVIMVQVLGVPHKMDELMALKEKYGFILLEDACAAMGASYHGKRVGSFGDLSSFSLYFGHQLSTIEGGLVSTDNKLFNDLLLLLRSHGWSKDLDKDTHNQLVKQYGIDDFHSPFIFYVPGYNLRSTDLNAFIGIRQIDKMDWLIKRRGENHAIYKKLLGDYLYTQKAPSDSVICSIHFGALAKDSEERKKIVKALEGNGIETRIFSAGNLGLHPFWYNKYGQASFPMADRIHHTGFFLPNNPSLSSQDIEFISKVVLDSIK